MATNHRPTNSLCSAALTCGSAKLKKIPRNDLWIKEFLTVHWWKGNFRVARGVRGVFEYLLKRKTIHNSQKPSKCCCFVYLFKILAHVNNTWFLVLIPVISPKYSLWPIELSNYHFFVIFDVPMETFFPQCKFTSVVLYTRVKRPV